ncbi:MAG TPA: DEAD/DEAH box helicase family protein [Patescibacteria group bacterium]|nr:DEAD/DEAH box helicase family protein [Patescibacteria group bacterium]
MLKKLFCDLCNVGGSQNRCRTCGISCCDDCFQVHLSICLKSGVLTPRYYQEEAAEAAIKDLEDHQSALIVQATGTGKTATAALVAKDIIAKRGGRILAISHTGELVRQIKSQFQKWLGVPVEIEMRELRASKGFPTHVSASLQTLMAGKPCENCAHQVDWLYADWKIRNPSLTMDDWEGTIVGCGGCVNGTVCRLMEFDPMEYSIVIIDEAHHSAAPSYRKVASWFRLNTNCGILGITATEQRSDGKKLGRVFRCPKITYRYGLKEGISDGYLVSIEVYQHTVTGWDLTKCHGKGEDYSRKKLSKVLGGMKSCIEIASLCVNHCKGMKTMVFAGDVEQAHTIASIINEYQIGSAIALDGKTPQHIRKSALDDFRSGKIQYLVNYNLFSEGFDEPSIQALVNARPTKSKTVYTQILGRGTRPLPECVKEPDAIRRIKAISSSDKPSLMVIDFIGQDARHQQVTLVDVIGDHYPVEVVKRVKSLIKDNKATMEEVEEILKQQDDKYKYDLSQQVEVRASTVLKKICPFDLTPKKALSGRPVSKAMKRALTKFGVGQEEVNEVNFEEARKLCGILFKRAQIGLASYKQCKMLREFGMNINVKVRTASAMIANELDKRGKLSSKKKE